jgi:hypothetical protein
MPQSPPVLADVLGFCADKVSLHRNRAAYPRFGRGTDWVTSRAVSAGPDFLLEEGGWTVGFWPGM